MPSRAQYLELKVSSNECFVWIENKKMDACIHGPILDNLNAGKASAALQTERLLKQGFTAEQIALLYG
jgi:hypothetical protein